MLNQSLSKRSLGERGSSMRRRCRYTIFIMAVRADASDTYRT
jgi:hypothetical protein